MFKSFSKTGASREIKIIDTSLPITNKTTFANYKSITFKNVETTCLSFKISNTRGFMLVSGSHDETIKLWNGKGNCTSTFNANGWVLCLTI